MSHLSTVALVVALAFATTQGPPTDRALPVIPDGVLSPDGRLVSYFDTANHELRVDDVRTRQSVARIAVTGYIGSSAVSWDGKMVAFSSGIAGEGAGLRVLSLPVAPGEAPRLLVKGSDIDPREWSRDGREILVSDDNAQFAIKLVSAIDGTSRVVKPMSPTSSLQFLALSPDAAFLAYDIAVPGVRNRAVFLTPTKGGADVALLEPTAWHSVVGWSPDGQQLAILSDRGGSPGLWSIPVRNGQRSGEPRLLKANFDGNPRAVLSTGEVLYERVTGPPAARLVTMRIDSNGQRASAPAPFVTRDPLAFVRFPRWSPDGKSFLYVTSKLLGPTVVIHSAETRDVREVPLPFYVFNTFDWSPDGRSLLFKGTNLERQNCLCLMDLRAGVVSNVAPPGAYYQPQFTGTSGAISYFKRVGQAPVGRVPGGEGWSYVERDLGSGVERPLVADLSRLMGEPRSYPAGRSPNGRFLLAEVIGDTSRLLAYDTTTAEVREVFRAAGTEAFNHYGDLQWTPDSRAVITTVATTPHELGNEQEVWWIPIDGRAPHKIEVGTTKVGENPIAIHPDGRQIAFVSGHPFNGVMPFDLRPRAVGSPLEWRLLQNLFPTSR